MSHYFENREIRFGSRTNDESMLCDEIREGANLHTDKNGKVTVTIGEDFSVNFPSMNVACLFLVSEKHDVESDVWDIASKSGISPDYKPIVEVVDTLFMLIQVKPHEELRLIHFDGNSWQYWVTPKDVKL